MSIAEKLTQLAGIKADIKAAINNKGQSVTDDMTEYANAINNISTGGDELPAAVVEFVDYDGTVLQSMPLAAAKQLTALPAGPTHEGLTFECWTHTLQDIQNANYSITIGPHFITTDGKTRVYITIDGAEGGRGDFCIQGRQSAANAITIDWGDESDPETIGAINNSLDFSIWHRYESPGNYVVTISCADGMSWGTILNTDKKLFEETGYHVNRIELGSAIDCIRSAFRDCSLMTSITIPRYYNNNSNNSSYAFANCSNLKFVPLSSEKTSFGANEFSSCGISQYVFVPNVTLPARCFYGTGIKSCVAKELEITTDNMGVFMNCSSLVYVKVLKQGITEIGKSMFSNCFSLLLFELPLTLTTIGADVFRDCTKYKPVIPQTVESIGSSAFLNTAIEEVNLPNLNSLGLRAFSWSKLKRVVSLGNLTVIACTSNNGPFMNCAYLESVVLPEALTEIQTTAFQNCTSLSIHIPQSVTAIGASAFSNTKEIDTINLPSLGSLGNAAFLKARIKGITSLGSISSLSGSQSNGVFTGCLLKGGVTLPSNITTIDWSTFESAVIADQRVLVIPSNVTSIGRRAFLGMGVTSIEFTSATPPGVTNTDSFGSLSWYVSIIVPAANYASYLGATNYGGLKVNMRKKGTTYSYGDVTRGKVIDTYGQGTIVNIASCSISDFIPVTGGHSVTFQRSGKYNNVYQYDSNKEIIARGGFNNATGTLNANAAYIRFNIENNGDDDYFGGVYDNTSDELIYPFEVQ